jgi:CRP/FNR family transcriptional regulator, cyclic AMP receptor protein
MGRSVAIGYTPPAAANCGRNGRYPVLQSRAQNEMLERISTVKKTIFSMLPEAQREALLSDSVVEEYAPKSSIFDEGGPGDSLYYIVSGEVSVRVKDDKGRQRRLTRLSAGDFFGELSLLDGRPRSATIVAMEQTQVRVIARDKFWRHAAENPIVAALVMQALAQRLREANRHIARL